MPWSPKHELAHLVRMRHAARLEHLQRAGALAVMFVVAQQQPGVHQRRDADFESARGAAVSLVRLVKSAVMPSFFRKSISRIKRGL